MINADIQAAAEAKPKQTPTNGYFKQICNNQDMIDTLNLYSKSARINTTKKAKETELIAKTITEKIMNAYNNNDDDDDKEWTIDENQVSSDDDDDDEYDSEDSEDGITNIDDFLNDEASECSEDEDEKTPVQQLGDDDDDDDDNLPLSEIRQAKRRRISSCDDGSEDDNDAAADEQETQLVKRYKCEFEPSYGVFAGFDVGNNAQRGSIPYLINVFKSPAFKPFDASVDDTCVDLCTKETTRKPAVDFCHVVEYLECEEFNKDLLNNTKYDHVVYAIFSFMVRWSETALRAFRLAYPSYSALANAILEVKRMQSDTFQIQQFNNEPFIRTSFKLLRKHFEDKIEPEMPRVKYNVSDVLNHKFIAHLHQVYDLLINNKFDEKSIADLLHNDVNDQYTLYRLQHFDVDQIVAGRNTDPKLNKYMTGEACCCKTSILRALSASGWKKYSRGDIGSFSGKAHSPVDIGNLHAALSYIHQQPDVIGDRGYIDNVLWSFIMPQCDMNRRDTMIKDLIDFLSSFNEPAIAQYLSHKAVIFVDPYSERLRARQLRRCTDGDALRARIFMYPYAQFIAYYAMARLFKWKLITVPYTSSGEIDQVRYQQDLSSVLEYFGQPQDSGHPFVQYQCPANLYNIDNKMPKSIGIYKWFIEKNKKNL